MKLQLQVQVEKSPIIRLKRTGDGVEVWIDDCYMALYRDNGELVVHGKSTSRRYTGRWDE